MNERAIKPGDRVRHSEEAALERLCGPAVVLAVDGEWPGVPACENRPAAWIRYTSPEGHHRYRSVEMFDLVLAGEAP